MVLGLLFPKKKQKKIVSGEDVHYLNTAFLETILNLEVQSKGKLHSSLPSYIVSETRHNGNLFAYPVI